MEIRKGRNKNAKNDKTANRWRCTHTHTHTHTHTYSVLVEEKEGVFNA